MQRNPRRFSRLCAFILAITMIIGMVPTTVFAMDGPLSGETGNHNDDILDADKLPPVDDATLKLKEKVELFNSQIVVVRK